MGLRFLAGVVDMTILCVLATIINLSAFGGPMAFMDQAMQRSPKLLVCLLGFLCVATLYYALFEGLWGAAAGKALCRLRVVGPDRNPPGFARAWLRALVYIAPPFVPYWAAFGMNPKAYMSSSLLTQMLLGCSIYGIMALLFVTARRRNGFAAVQDLLTRTWVVSRAAVSSRLVLATGETPPPATGSAITIGPYHVLQALTESATEKWFLAYDLKLLRKVWIRVVLPGMPPVPVPLRSLGRVGRLRWLTGKRSSEENWDAFEALDGQSFLELIGSPQPWREVRGPGSMIWPRRSALRREKGPCLNWPLTGFGSQAMAEPRCWTFPYLVRQGNPKTEIRRPNRIWFRRFKPLKASWPKWPRRHWKGLGRQAPRLLAT